VNSISQAIILDSSFQRSHIILFSVQGFANNQRMDRAQLAQRVKENVLALPWREPTEETHNGNFTKPEA
jgi:hypothetical protein